MMADRAQRAMPAHNTVISVLVEGGLIGFAFYFLFWGLVVRQVWVLPKADRFYWFGVLVLCLPLTLSTSSEYWKPLWFLGALVLCQAGYNKAVAANRRRIPMLRPGVAVPPLPPVPQRPRPLATETDKQQEK